jgi:hypothetical protein
LPVRLQIWVVTSCCEMTFADREPQRNRTDGDTDCSPQSDYFRIVARIHQRVSPLTSLIRLSGGRTWWAHFEFTRLFGAARRAAQSAASFKLRRICREQVESRYSNETTNSSGSHPVRVLLQALRVRPLAGARKQPLTSAHQDH